MLEVWRKGKRDLQLASPITAALVSLAGARARSARFFGLLLSLPSALVTKTYVPILAVGGLGGLLIGGFLHGWG